MFSSDWFFNNVLDIIIFMLEYNMIMIIFLGRLASNHKQDILDDWNGFLENKMKLR